MGLTQLDNQFTLFIIISALIFTTFILMIITIVNTIKISKLKNHYKSFMKNTVSGVSIEELLAVLIDETRSYAKTQSMLERRTSSLEHRISGCFQKFGIVRYNPYDDTGGDFSYAIAILDETNSGVVLNGIYNRQGSFTYAKHIENGAATKHKLTQEEEDAVTVAIGTVKY